jgi:hypothetical protein
MPPVWKPGMPPAFPTVHQKPICPGREVIVWRAHLYIISGIVTKPYVWAVALVRSVSADLGLQPQYVSPTRPEPANLTCVEPE